MKFVKWKIARESMKDFERICCQNFVEANGYAYFSNWFYNGMFMVEIETGRTIFLGDFGGEKSCGIRIHEEIFLKNEKIYFCPGRGGHVHIYDLEDHSMKSISIRKNSTEFFVTANVILKDEHIYFIPKQEGISIRKLDLKSLNVSEESKSFKPQGMILAENKEVFPALWLVEKEQIELADFFSWKQLYHKMWYSFLPTGRWLLKYAEGKNEIERVPLIVLNEAALKNYLRYVREEALREKIISEKSNRLNIQDYLEYIMRKDNFKYDGLNGSCRVGLRVWESFSDTFQRAL